MKLLPLIFAILLSCHAFGQFEKAKYPEYTDKSFNLESDTVYKNSYASADQKIDSLFHLDKQYDFEFRFWKEGMEENSKALFVMRHKNNTWNARYFIPKQAKPYWTELKTDQTKLDQLWYYLKTNNLLTLPNENQLQSRMTTYQIDTTRLGSMMRSATVITDGVLYSFGLRTPGKKRFYSYGNPQILQKIYPNVSELAHTTMIVFIINRYLGLPLNY